MKFLHIAAQMILLLWLPSIAAQEIGYLDLSDNNFRERSRQTRSVGGGCGGTSHSVESQAMEVTATIVSLDKMRYRIGEEVTFEIKILNSGKRTLIVPWTPHLGDLEPADPRSSYKYRVGVVVLSFSDPEGNEFSVSESLYGSSNLSGTLRELSPGEWFTVRGRKTVEFVGHNWGQKEFQDSGFVEAKVTGFYRQDNGTYSPNNGGKDTQWCIPFPCQRGNQIDVTIEQR